MSKRSDCKPPDLRTESVWDYPRPPRLEVVTEQITVAFGGEMISDSRGAYRVLETTHPPVYYLPPADVRMDLLMPAGGGSSCEFKGEATYVTIAAGGRRSERAGWRYLQPTHAFRAIAGHVAFYASSDNRARFRRFTPIARPRAEKKAPDHRLACGN